jgi:SNF2 family DNA or RNA helicase
MKKSTQDSRVSYYKKPSDLSSEQYQIKLRLQFGEDHPFVIQNVGSQGIFSDYLVKNPQTGNSYKVSIRDFKNQWNYCSCLDFKTNQLGVCKHTASVFNHLRTKFGKDESNNEHFIGSYSSVYVDYKNGRFVKLKIGTENQEKYKILATRYFDAQLNLLGTSFPVFETFLKEAKAISEDFKCYEDALDLVLETRENIKRRVTVLDAFAKKNKVQILDSVLKTKLFPFQVEGVLFASLAARSLIADEMGLGKTIQALATAEVYKQLFKISKVLIVCPTSLKYQWKSEIEKFTDSKAEIIEGTGEARKQQLSTSEAFYLISSYQSVSNDIQDSNGDFGLDMVILDEAQRIKNWSTKVAGNIKKLQSPYAVVLTGTPLENKLEELYSIMQFVDVWKLGPLYKFLDNHRVIDPQSQKVIGYKNLNVISEELSDTLLRRTKKEVLGQLPERSDKTLLVAMTREQRDIHDKLKAGFEIGFKMAEVGILKRKRPADAHSQSLKNEDGL